MANLGTIGMTSGLGGQLGSMIYTETPFGN